MPDPIAVDVCLCTFRRPAVTAALASVEAQDLPPGVALRVIVADNDETPTSAERVAGAAAGMRHEVTYLHAPARNISVARNACLDRADAPFVAFLDDDEVAAPDWIARLLACLEGADVVFGPAVARYPAGTPAWITANDFHSNRPVSRGGTVETGHTCNVMLRFAGTPAATARFDTALGRSGGEDTDFFFRLHRQGMRLAICEAAVVHEDVVPARLRLRWLAERRFAEGRHYGHAAGGGRARRFLGSLAKIGYSGLRALGAAGDRPRLAFWGLRAVFHAGVCSGCIRGPGGRVAYGG